MSLSQQDEDPQLDFTNEVSAPKNDRQTPEENKDSTSNEKSSNQRPRSTSLQSSEMQNLSNSQRLKRGSQMSSAASGDVVLRRLSDEDQDDSFKSHSSAFLSKSSDNINDSTAQYNYDQLMDDKTFIFSKIKGEFKDEYKVLHNLRSMPKP